MTDAEMELSEDKNFEEFINAIGTQVQALALQKGLGIMDQMQALANIMGTIIAYQELTEAEKIELVEDMRHLTRHCVKSVTAELESRDALKH